MTEVFVEEDFAALAAEWITRHVNEAIAEWGSAHVALCGGGTPAPIYRRLDLDWDRVHLYFGDERCVAPDHEDSTYRLVMEAFDGPVHVHRMEGEDPDFEAAARRYEALLPERLDVAIQGMGPDGHTASLFPGHPIMSVTGRRVAHVANSPKPPPDRLTLTVMELQAARHTVVLAPGAAKAPAVARALEGALDLTACPVQVCRDGAWFLDPASAADLG